MAKVVAIGLDGANPDLIYQWIGELPNLKGLMERGIHGYISSSIPPITPQAWTSALSGTNPGQFGFWNFVYRDDYGYGEPKLVSSQAIPVDMLYHILPRQGKRMAAINIPVTYPPVAIPGGYCISCFMTPSLERGFTHPPELRREVEALIGEYILDASTGDTNFRDMDKDLVLERIYRMDRQRFDLVKYFIEEKGCDLIFAVVMGTDRMPHLFYRYMDEEHVRYVPDSKYALALKEHYKFCDGQIGDILETIDGDTAVMVLSDHSVQRLDGRVNLNDWLIQEGYLVLKRAPSGAIPFRQAEVDWARTTAWGTGYTGQLYLNLKGREAQGAVAPEEYDAVLEELAQKIQAIPRADGRKMATQVIKRKDVYHGPRAQFAPDLFIYFDDLHYNISERVGQDSLYSYDTPLGEDDGGHGPWGIFVLAGPGVEARGRLEGASLVDVAPTIMELMGLEPTPQMEGHSLLERHRSVYSSQDEEEVRRRLAGLGYMG